MQNHPNDYGFLSRLLHYLILNNSLVKKTAFDLENRINRNETEKIKINNPVYVTGLARAGTTILLKTLYSSNFFASLTYRDMPLVTAPGIWSKIPQINKRKSKLKQRAHGDDFLINYDSPEALEEIFWLTFSNNKYILKNRLEPQNDLSPELIKQYKNFIHNVILCYQKKSNSLKLRYLAKNNNNLIRINVLKKTFPEATIIVPIRHPVNHAHSLLNQHLRFIKLQKQNNFTLKYMNWLGHFEFGANLKPLNLNNFSKTAKNPQSINYWLDYWNHVHEYLIENCANKVEFMNYEDFCREPRTLLEKLEKKLSLQKNDLFKNAPELRPPKKYSEHSMDDKLIKKAKAIHKTLLEKTI